MPRCHRWRCATTLISLEPSKLAEALLIEAEDTDAEEDHPYGDAAVYQLTPDAESDDSDDQPPLSRKEQKALERKIPWREIVNAPSERFKKYVEATQKEVNSFHHWESVRPLSDEHVNAIYRDPSLRKRTLRARMAFRNKNTSKPTLEELAKCRCVLLGCFDPDLTKLEGYAPTATQIGFFMLLQVYSTGLMDSRGNWTMAVADIQSISSGHTW